MHPRALIYHPARMDFNCLPLYHNAIHAQERAQRIPLSEIFGKDPVPKSEAEARGARNIAAGVMLESVLARKVADVLDGKGEESDEVRTYAQEFGFLLSDLRDYRADGENIFHFQPAIIDLFRRSDLGDASVNRLKLPFEHFYLHFGGLSEVKVGPNHTWDGAYISNIDNRPHREDDTIGLFVRLVTRSVHGSYDSRRDPIRFLLSDPTCNAHLWFEETKGIETAIAKAVQELPDGDDYRNIPGFRELWTPSAVDAVLHLVANALLFLASEHSEVTHRYPIDAPDNLVRKAEVGDGENQRERAASKLWGLGFKKVHFVGDSIEREAADRRTRGELLEAHWRRGHWRSQVYGPSNTLRKAVWIRPTIVRPDLGDPHAKRIYGVPQ